MGISYPSRLDLFFANLFILLGSICLPTAFIVGGFLGYKIYIATGTLFGVAILIKADQP